MDNEVKNESVASEIFGTIRWIAFLVFLAFLAHSWACDKTLPVL